MTTMIELFKIIRLIKLVGLNHLIKLRKAKFFGEGIIRGYFLTRTISTLFNIGFFDEFKNGKKVDLELFSQKKNLNKIIFKALCDYLFSLKILEKEKFNYSLSNNGKLLMNELRGFFDIAYAYEDVFHCLEPLVKMEEEYGKGVKRREEFVAKGSGNAAKLLPFPIVQDIIKRKNFNTILDLGCGDATFLIDLCEKYPNIKGYGLDISQEAVNYGLKKLEEKKLDDRIILLVGDMFEVDKIKEMLGQIDAVTSFYALHEFISPETNKVEVFLTKFKEVFQDTPLIICELMREPPEKIRKNPSFALEHYLFHDLSNQRQISRDEWKEILRKAGFNYIEEEYVDLAKVGIYVAS